MELTEIRKQLPSGAIKEIAKRTKTSTTTVSLTFKEKINSPKKPEILKATAEYLAEYKTKEREANEALKAALSVV